MGIDSIRAALQLVTGAGELTRTKALEVAGGLLNLPGVGPTAARATAAAGQVSSLADELVAAAAANREMVRELVAQELAAQLQKIGVATVADADSLRDEVDRLTVKVAAMEARMPAAADGPAPRTAAKKAAARPTATAPGAAAKKTAAKRTAKKAAAGSTGRAAKKTTRQGPA